MKRPGTTSIILGVGLFVLIIAVYPFARPALEAAATTILAITPGASAFETFVIDSIPFWGLGMAFLAAFLVILKGAKE